MDTVRVSPRASYAAAIYYGGKMDTVERASGAARWTLDLNPMTSHPTNLGTFFNETETVFVVFDRSSKMDIVVFDAAGGRVLGRVSGNAGTPLAVSADTRLLVAGRYDPSLTGENYRLEIYDVATGKLVRELGHDDSLPGTFSFSPDGKRLAGSYRTTTVRLWDVETAEVLGTLAGHSVAVVASAFHPGGKVLASASVCGASIGPNPSVFFFQ